MIEPGLAAELARELLDAERRAVGVEPLTERHRGMSVDDAYAVQLAGRQMREAAGTTIVGRKVGLTSRAMQELLGVDEPDFGYLTDAMMHADSDHIALAALIAPRVEAEIALRLERRIVGEHVSFDEAVHSVSEVAPALEVVDSRVRDWRITLADTVADNASSGLAVIGAFRPRGDLDLAAIEMEIAVDHGDGRREVEKGPGSAVLGHPVHALVWLARALARYGEGIEAGQVVIPGAMARAIPLTGPAEVTARFTDLGSVAAVFLDRREGAR